MNKTCTIVGFGDSITLCSRPAEGRKWLQLLNAQLEGAYPECRFTVINSGVGGNSAREAMERFDADVAAHRPDIVLLQFGGNNLKRLDPGQMVDLDEFRTHLKRFQAGMVKLGEPTVIVITFPPIVDSWHAKAMNYSLEMYEKWGGVDAFIEVYRAETRVFARSNGHSLLDLSVELRQRAPSDPGRFILPDGVHLTDAGNRVLADLAFAAVHTEKMVADEAGRAEERRIGA
ncbi:MAG: hypothetical protein KAI66_05400 [Lentisphaeria bacterium]|nr:hypothetical protein [Lentisphaeria bacterium]